MAAERGHLDVVKYLVGQEADINNKDDYGVCDNDETHVKLCTGCTTDSRLVSIA